MGPPVSTGLSALDKPGRELTLNSTADLAAADLSSDQKSMLAQQAAMDLERIMNDRQGATAVMPPPITRDRRAQPPVAAPDPPNAPSASVLAAADAAWTSSAAPKAPAPPGATESDDRSEERRVGKEWRSRWSPDD